MTERQRRNNIRKRDRQQYGNIPDGMQMHHLWYSDDYNPDSFVIISNEEHIKIHGNHYIPENKGFDYSKRRKEYYKAHREEAIKYSTEYVETHKEETKEYKANYYQLNKDKIKERTAINNAKVKAVRESLGLTQKQWWALTKEDRKQFMDTFMVNGGIMI